MQVSDGGDAGEEEVRSLNNRVRSGYVRVVCGGCEFELPALMPSGLPTAGECNVAGDAPELHEVLAAVH